MTDGKKSLMVSLLAVSLLSGFAAVAVAPTARAASVTINLYGTAMGGWGTTSGGETMPGPTLSVNKDDVVTLVLHSEDGLPHRFLLDYNGNGVVDSGEPASSFFTGMTTLVFTASLAGTFNYLCTVHPMMSGTWKTVAPPPTVHDVAVTGVTATPLSVIKGDTVYVSVTITNLGDFGESVTVQAFGGSILIDSQLVALAKGGSASVFFMWNTTPVSVGSYLIVGKAIPVTGESNIGNNVMNDGTVVVNPLPPGPLKAVLVGHSAWPDFHHLAIHSKGSVQTLFGKVANVGPGPVNAKVIFQIRNAATGALVVTVESNVPTIAVGGIVVVSGTWTAVPGSYGVTAQCWYDTNNDGIFDGSDPGVKTFTFKVVP